MKIKSKNNCKIRANEHTTYDEHTDYKTVKNFRGLIYQIFINLTMISYAIYTNDFKSFLNFLIVNILVLNFIYADFIFYYVVKTGSNVLNFYKTHAKCSHNVFNSVNNFSNIEFPNSSKITGIKPIQNIQNIQPNKAVKKGSPDIESFQHI
ncbi:hypothetical protein [Methanococcus voltae]|uniref:Uncharacterized protein n=1 Tax=Methanococcus voltae PS TaxID=523842 RepID=A0ABT2EVU8_METVO|nr:hypothetical protein [Methanococcus voltae]MBP2173024.1 hypothetical protein [Methanococcus voltae]MCS3922084.1 hypothetical protein [Methanococcus voltae PS]